MTLGEALLDLQQLTERLRRDCPWDREQTAKTIVPHTVEEAYEVADAALSEDCWRWVPVPITYVPYGDFGEELTVSGVNLVDGATTAWSTSNSTPSFVSQTPPHEFVRRVVRVTASGVGGYLQGRPIDVDVDNRSAWRIEALCRAQGAASAGGDARIVLRDETAGANITPTSAMNFFIFH